MKSSGTQSISSDCIYVYHINQYKLIASFFFRLTIAFNQLLSVTSLNYKGYIIQLKQRLQSLKGVGQGRSNKDHTKISKVGFLEYATT